MNLYVEEMEDISQIIKAYQNFIADAFGSFSEIEVDFEGSINLTITSRNSGKIIGFVGYTADGAIGFITDEPGPVA
jgi:predicted RNA-binding protein Jag